MKNTLAYYNTKLIATVEWGPIKGSIWVGFSLKVKNTIIIPSPIRRSIRVGFCPRMKNTLAYYDTKLIATVEWGPIKGSIRVGFSLKVKNTIIIPSPIRRSIWVGFCP
jgi:hypothetical protein